MISETLIIIPMRIGSTRLKEKALELIGDKTMIEWVSRQVMASGLDNIFVATDSEKIVDILKPMNIKTIMTKPECASGTDRVYEAWQTLPNKDNFKYIINVQGDMPFVKTEIISELAKNLWKSDCDIITPVTLVSKEEAEGFSNVKVVRTKSNKALYFSRSLIPSMATDFLYHIGVYGYKADSLSKFVQLEPSYLENSERLEQLRAIENDMTIEVFETNSVPISIDTLEDLNKAKDYYNKNY